MIASQAAMNTGCTTLKQRNKPKKWPQLFVTGDHQVS